MKKEKKIEKVLFRPIYGTDKGLYMIYQQCREATALRYGEKTGGQNMHALTGKTKNRMFIGTLIIMVIMICTFTITVNGMTRDNTAEQQQYYDALESDYLTRIDCVLQEYDLYYSGINMTRISAEDGSRSYSVRIHNSRVEKLGEERMGRLLEALQTISFGDPMVMITYEL